VTGGGCDSNKTGNDTKTNINDGKLFAEDLVREHPSESTGSSRESSVGEGNDGTDVERKIGTSVEAKPTEKD